MEEDCEEEVECTNKSVTQIQQQIQQVLHQHFGEGEALDPEVIKELILQVTCCGYH